ncbi:HupE/UreJ family protein [uncultured Maribacter sp.]|uniref:HupE/UreJ family protein n=1 Tax=uncultured Maribacter sp. TaxID=431308 RepID=UPI0026235BF2|nr:HupE/UreJ family protein [uncultured Maribacter sp.]
MDNLWFYVTLGLDHVLDFSAYDHILFLTALTLPFTFKNWKNVLLLATVFTIAHCTSLVFSVFEVVVMDVTFIEFLIPVTIFITVIFNLLYAKTQQQQKSILLLVIATSFFGLIHGFGFSNYFKMLMAGEEEKITPLFGFAFGIEFSQIIIVLSVLAIAFSVQTWLHVKQRYFVIIGSIAALLITIPMLINTFPW